MFVYIMEIQPVGNADPPNPNKEFYGRTDSFTSSVNI